MEREKACCCYSWTDRAKERPNYVGLSFIYFLVSHPVEAYFFFLKKEYNSKNNSLMAL